MTEISTQEALQREVGRPLTQMLEQRMREIAQEETARFATLLARRCSWEGKYNMEERILRAVDSFKAGVDAT